MESGAGSPYSNETRLTLHCLAGPANRVPGGPLWRLLNRLRRDGAVVRGDPANATDQKRSATSTAARPRGRDSRQVAGAVAHEGPAHAAEIREHQFSGLLVGHRLG